MEDFTTVLRGFRPFAVIVLVLLMAERIATSAKRTEKHMAKLAGDSDAEALSKSRGSTAFMVVILWAFGAAALWAVLK
jgi:hypothetical protein